MNPFVTPFRGWQKDSTYTWVLKPLWPLGLLSFVSGKQEEEEEEEEEERRSHLAQLREPYHPEMQLHRISDRTIWAYSFVPHINHVASQIEA